MSSETFTKSSHIFAEISDEKLAGIVFSTRAYIRDIYLLLQNFLIYLN